MDSYLYTDMKRQQVDLSIPESAVFNMILEAFKECFFGKTRSISLYRKRRNHE